MEIGNKGVDLKGHFVSDINLGLHLISSISGHKWLLCAQVG